MLSFVMNNYMGHFLLGEGEGGWVQLLIFVAVGGIWLLGNIMKARSDKLEEQKREERKKNAPARSPEREAAYRKQLAARQARLQQQIRQRQTSDSAAKPVMSKAAYKRPVSVGQRPAGYRVPLEQKLKKLAFPAEMPILVADDLEVEPVRQVQKARVPPPRVQKTRRAPVIKMYDEDEEQIEIFAGGGDWNEFQRAILYLEILGKPVSLRGPIA